MLSQPLQLLTKYEKKIQAIFKSTQIKPFVNNNMETGVYVLLIILAVSEARRSWQNVRKQVSYMAHRSQQVDEVGIRVAADVQLLLAKATQARQAAVGVDIAIASTWKKRQRFTDTAAPNRPEYAGTPVPNLAGCARSFRVNLTSSLTTRIQLLYALDNDDQRDGSLVYLASSVRPGEFLSISLVDRQVQI